MDSLVELAYMLLGIVSALFSLIKQLCMLNFPYAKAISLTAFCLHGAVRAKKAELSANVGPRYWFHSLVLSVGSSFFGGCIAPIMLGRVPIIITNDVMIPLSTVFWYALNRLNALRLAEVLPVKLVWTGLAALFRAHGCIKAVILANELLPPSTYGDVALVGPIVVGTVMSTGGLFFPVDCGLASISKGMPWGVQAPLLTATLYHLLVHDTTGPLGGVLRGAVGSHSETTVKCALALYWLASSLVQVCFDTEANFMTPFHKAAYLLFQVQGPLIYKNATKHRLSTVGWNYCTRAHLTVALELMRVLVLAVAMAVGVALYVPPTALTTGVQVGVGQSVAGVAQLNHFAPWAHGQPFSLWFEQVGDTPSLRLAVYKGDATTLRSAQPSDAVWSTKTAYASNTGVVSSVYLSLGEDGRLRAIERQDTASQEKELWRSGSACPASPSRAVPILRLDAMSGAPTVHCSDGTTILVK